VPPAAVPAAPASSPRPAQAPSRLGQYLPLGDVLLAAVGTGLGALAAFLSRVYLPRLGWPLMPWALTISLTLAALLASIACILLAAYGVFVSRASQRRMRLKKLIQKEKTFFMTIDADVAVLAKARGGRHG
jgi:hypothetical protein